jgi:predicted RNase H-like HicB family nuclease
MLNYSIAIKYDNRDKIYVASVPELEGCSAHGKTPEQAVKEIQVAVEGWLEAAKEHGYKIPDPMLYVS